MADFTGGYTSAVNDVTARQGTEATAAHLMQLIAARATAERNAAIDRERMMQARTNAGMALPMIFSPPPMGAQAQPPLPGQPSVPMTMPPPLGMPAPGGMMAPPQMPPGAPAAAPAGAAPETPPPSPEASAPPAAPIGAPSWQTSPAALARANPLQDAQEGGGSSEILAPPPQVAPKLPAELLSAETAVRALTKLNLPPGQMIDALERIEPLIQHQNKATLLNAQIEARSADVGLKAAKAENDRLRAEAYAKNVDSLDASRARRAGQRDEEQETREKNAETARIRAERGSARTGGAGAAPGATGGLTPAGLDLAAAEFRKTGRMPPLGTRNAADRQAIINRAAQQVQEAGSALVDVPAERGAFKADASSLAFQQKQVDAIERSSVKIEKDIKTLEKYIDSGTAGSVTLINKPINYLRTQFSDPALTEFAVAAKLVGVEYERMINGGLMSVAQLHEGAREDAKQLINEAMTPQQIRRVLPVMRQEIDNAKQASREQITDIKSRMQTTPKAGAAAPAGAPKVGDVQKGYRFKGGDPSKPGSWEKVL